MCRAISIESASSYICTFFWFSLSLTIVTKAAENPAQEGASQQLRQIGIAMHQYHDMHDAFPLAGSEDAGLRIGLSWRVRILPYLGERALYEKFDLNSPWDSPHNRTLAAQMPEVYKAPYVELDEGTTTYLGVITSTERVLWNGRELGTFFHRQVRPRRISEISDGTGYTIMVVAADPSEAVVWTKPTDWEFDPQTPRRRLGSRHLNGFVALFADGSPGIVPHSIADDTLRRLFWINDGERVEAYTPPAFQGKAVRP